MVMIFLFTCNDNHIHSLIHVRSSDCYNISASCPEQHEVLLIIQTKRFIVGLQFLLLCRARVDYDMYCTCTCTYMGSIPGFCLMNHDWIPTLCAIRLKYMYIGKPYLLWSSRARRLSCHPHDSSQKLKDKMLPS